LWEGKRAFLSQFVSEIPSEDGFVGEACEERVAVGRELALQKKEDKQSSKKRCATEQTTKEFVAQQSFADQSQQKISLDDRTKWHKRQMGSNRQRGHGKDTQRTSVKKLFPGDNERLCHATDLFSEMVEEEEEAVGVEDEVSQSKAKSCATVRIKRREELIESVSNPPVWLFNVVNSSCVSDTNKSTREEMRTRIERRRRNNRPGRKIKIVPSVSPTNKYSFCSHCFIEEPEERKASTRPPFCLSDEETEVEVDLEEEDEDEGSASLRLRAGPTVPQSI